MFSDRAAPVRTVDAPRADVVGPDAVEPDAVGLETSGPDAPGPATPAPAPAAPDPVDADEDDPEEAAVIADPEPVLVERVPAGAVPRGTLTPDTGRPTNSSARTRARKAALDVLFESEMRHLPTGATLGERITAAAGTDPTFRPVRAYTVTLVEGVRAEGERIDELISTYARDWSLERMPGVDRAILRIGVWELLYNRDVPPAAVISEAVGLASSLSTDASPGFVNGLLARIADLVTDV